MSLLDLQSVLQHQADTNGGVITVSEEMLNRANLTPAPAFEKTIRSYLNLTDPLSVTVTSPIPAPVGSTLALTGIASFLGVENVTVQVIFTLEASDNTVDLLLDATLPSSWTFSTSFPLLVGFPFADINLTQSSYLLTTAAQTAYTWQQQNVTVVKGLNLASFLGLGGPLAILTTLMSAPTETIVFTGTIDSSAIADRTRELPPVSLIGTVNANVTAQTHFDLSSPQVLVISTKDENFSAYWLALRTTLNVGGNPFSSFQAAILPSESNLTLSMVPTTNLITPAEIIELIGGVDFRESIPDELKKVFESVELRSLAASINIKPETVSVLALSGGIGTVKGNTWHMGQFGDIEDIVLNCQVLSPFSTDQSVLVSFGFTAHIFPNIFEGEFDFELSYDTSSQELDIAANFQGTVSINALVEGLSDGTIKIPPSLALIEFDDFGMTFTKAGSDYNYTLYGSAKGTFNITMLGSPIVATFEISVDSVTNSYVLIGGLTIGDSFFQATADLSGSKQILIGSWSALNNDFLTFQKLLTAFKLEGPQIPHDLDLALKSASINYNLKDETLVISAESANYGSAVFASLPVNNTQEYFFLLGVDKSFNLSNLPLVGEELAKIESIAIGKFLIIIGSTTADATTVALVNDLITNMGASGVPVLPDNGTTSKFSLFAELDFGDQKLPLNLSIGGSATGTSVPPTTALITTTSPGGGSVTSSSTPDGTTWYTIQKSFGPVTIQRIGALYQSDQQTLWFEIDGTLAFGPMSLSLAGLGIGSSIKDFSPQFSLQGLSVSYSEPPLEIAGTLVNLEPPGSSFIKFEGGVTIGTGDFILEAFGYYGNDTGFSSMFIFGMLEYDFGGPPAFFVTGVALGFGYNSNLRVPTIDEVQSFPFVQVLGPNQALFPNNEPLQVLKVITDTKPPWVQPQAGSLWFAAGITFTSFELVNSQALVMVEFGSGLVLALVGTSRAQFPQPTGSANEPVYAYIELDLLLRFAPAEGVFSLQAVLAKSSFLLDRACVLTGGFAFFVWFGDNPHAGDFVLTLGGYNPGFTPPSHYPVVPAVGFHWSLDSTISITGSAYFAFTPSVLMVGGELNATYHSGNIQAWFDAHADLIVQWKPFWFNAEIGITVGASYKINLLFTTATVSVELGCNLEIWGPPTGGTVTVNWYIIKFTIPFGSGPTSKPTITGWPDVQAMLPNTGTATAPNVLSLAPSNGISPNTTKPGNSAATSGDASSAPWIVRGSQFGFNTSSSIPATTAKVGGSYAFNGSKFNVAPLGWSEVSAVHNIEITDPLKNDFSSKFSAVQIQKSLPASLWGSPPSVTPTSNDQLVPNQIIGVSLQVNPPQIGRSAGPVNVQLQLEVKPLNLPGAVLPVSGSASPSGDVPINRQTTISIIANSQSGISSTDTIEARRKILAALQSVSYAPATANDPMANFVKEIACVLAGEPLLVS